MATPETIFRANKLINLYKNLYDHKPIDDCRVEVDPSEFDLMVELCMDAIRVELSNKNKISSGALKDHINELEGEKNVT